MRIRDVQNVLTTGTDRFIWLFQIPQDNVAVKSRHIKEEFVLLMKTLDSHGTHFRSPHFSNSFSVVFVFYSPRCIPICNIDHHVQGFLASMHQKPL